MPREVVFGLLDQFIKLPDQRQDGDDPHHRHRGQRKEDVAAGLFHRRTAKPRDPQISSPGRQFLDQVRGMIVATRFADGKKDVHDPAR